MKANVLSICTSVSSAEYRWAMVNCFQTFGSQMKLSVDCRAAAIVSGLQTLAGDIWQRVIVETSLCVPGLDWVVPSPWLRKYFVGAVKYCRTDFVYLPQKISIILPFIVCKVCIYTSNTVIIAFGTKTCNYLQLLDTYNYNFHSQFLGSLTSFAVWIHLLCHSVGCRVVLLTVYCPDMLVRLCSKRIGSNPSLPI